METANKLTYLSTKFFTENKEEYRITVTVSLDDDCHNNMCDWRVTADVRWKNQRGQYKEYMGGCCHDEVAKHFPELAKFISLHLCNHYGAPMYPVENGIYHVRRSGMSVAMEYLRISEQECAELYKASEDELYFKYQLFNLGIVKGVQHGDWVRCTQCGAQMLLPRGADQCPECYGYDTLVWVDEDRQEMDTKHLDCLAPMRKLELQEYLSQDVLAIEHSEYYKQLIGEDEWCEEEI